VEGAYQRKSDPAGAGWNTQVRKVFFPTCPHRESEADENEEEILQQKFQASLGPEVSAQWKCGWPLRTLVVTEYMRSQRVHAKPWVARGSFLPSDVFFFIFFFSKRSSGENPV
jgi:hypothetical protein